MCSIPLLNLVDQPGFAVGSAAEKAATIRHGASAMSALYSARIPIFTVIVRRAFGVAGGAFAHPEDDNNNRVAWYGYLYLVCLVLTFWLQAFR